MRFYQSRCSFQNDSVKRYSLPLRGKHLAVISRRQQATALRITPIPRLRPVRPSRPFPFVGEYGKFCRLISRVKMPIPHEYPSAHAPPPHRRAGACSRRVKIKNSHKPPSAHAPPSPTVILEGAMRPIESQRKRKLSFLRHVRGCPRKVRT